MNIVDSSGWIEFFLDGPNAGIFEVPITETQDLLVPTISVYEVYRKILVHAGKEAALLAVSRMRAGTPVDLGFQGAVQAASASAQLRLPMADAIILSAARFLGATLWTQDSDFKGLPGVRYISPRA